MIILFRIYIHLLVFLLVRLRGQKFHLCQIQIYINIAHMTEILQV